MGLFIGKKEQIMEEQKLPQKLKNNWKKKLEGKKVSELKNCQNLINFLAQQYEDTLKRNHGAKYRVAIRKPGLSTKNIVDRKKFYKKALNFGINNILNKIFG